MSKCCSNHDCGQGESQVCSTQGGTCPACGGQCCGDPSECSVIMWERAFFTAMHELHVEILKEKMRQNWGTQMEKAADAVMAAMETKWQSMVSDKQAKDELKAKLEDLWKS